MARPNRERQQRIYEYVLGTPGASKAEVARAIGVSYSALVGILPSLNRGGYLISEDESGRLWPFEVPSLTLDTIKQVIGDLRLMSGALPEAFWAGNVQNSGENRAK